MMITRRLATLAFAAAVMACGVPATNAGDLHGFTSDKKQDLFGYYMPTEELRFGKFVLHNISLADPADFKKFESGGYKGVPFAAVMFEFDDTTSQKKQGELGEYYVNAPRVLPTAYSLQGANLQFVGTDKQVGVVAFTGTLDLAQVKKTKNGGDANAVVMRGDLTVGGKTVKGVTFSWFGGD
jgi:hypothetical protein